MAVEGTSQANVNVIKTAVAMSSWSAGPWSDSLLDVPGFYGGCPTRETSHPEWCKLFSGSLESQKDVISWVHTYHQKKGKRPESAEFAAMVNRFALARAVCQHVLRPAAVSEDMCSEFLSNVHFGMHHGALDAPYSSVLADDFRFDQHHLRSWATVNLPFVDTIIQQHKIQHIGLSPQKIHELELQTDMEASSSYRNKLMMDISTYAMWKASWAAKREEFATAAQAHQLEVVAQARAAAKKFLFGAVTSDGAASSDVSGGQCSLNHVAIGDYRTRVPHLINTFTRSICSSAVAARHSVLEADAAHLVIADLASVGSLKDSAGSSRVGYLLWFA